MSEGFDFGLIFQTKGRKLIKNFKFLGFVDPQNLKLLEDLLKTDLGYMKDPNKRRPFVYVEQGEYLIVFFLTTKKFYKDKDTNIDLGACVKTASECKWIKRNSYLFYDRHRKRITGYRLKSGVFNFIGCGYCKDLDIIDKYIEENCVVSFEDRRV